MLRALLVAIGVAACASASSPAETSRPRPAGSRHRIDVQLRGRIADADPCDKLDWLTQLAQGAGMEQEVAEELTAERTYRCLERSAPPKPAPIPPPPVDLVACSRARAKAELDRRGAAADDAAIEAGFSHCVYDRVTECQLALDVGVDQAIACWEHGAWPEVPATVDADDVRRTDLCLHETKVIEDDIRTCATKAKRDACVAPYASYTPLCGMLDATGSWRAFVSHDEVDRQTRQAELLAAERAAKLAKEDERCSGHTTLMFATRLKAEPTLVAARGCRYQVVGRVVSTNNVFVAIVDPTSGGAMHLLRTREPFADGTAFGGAGGAKRSPDGDVIDRVAVFDGIEKAEMADGSTQALAVFKLQKP